MKSLKIASMAAIALIAAGCASQPKVDENSEIAALRADIAEVKSIAMQANENAMLARQQAQENSEKINRSFRGQTIQVSNCRTYSEKSTARCFFLACDLQV